VRTSAGEIECPQTVICAGPWSASVGALLGLQLPIVPSPRQVFVSEPFAGIRRQSPMTIDFHTPFYFHPEGEGVLFGMSDPATPPSSPSGTWCNEARFAAWRPPPHHRRRLECLHRAGGFAPALGAGGGGGRRAHHLDEGLPGPTGGEPSPRSVFGDQGGDPQP